MSNWNVVVTTTAGQYAKACELLRPYGSIARTDYFNVLTLQVEDIAHFLECLHDDTADDPDMAQSLGRVMPVTVQFQFQSPAEFEVEACHAVAPWLGQLAGSRFHVRMHRRGFRNRISSQDEEQFLDHYIVEGTGPTAAAVIDFADPDYILAVETLGQDAGLSLWDRAARARYAFLRLD